MKKIIIIAIALFAASMASAAGFDINWTDNSNAEDGFIVERSSDGVTFTEVGRTVTDATTYNDETVLEGQTYYYRVKAYNSEIESSYTEVSQATYPLNAPSDINIDINLTPAS